MTDIQKLAAKHVAYEENVQEQGVIESKIFVPEFWRLFVCSKVLAICAKLIVGATCDSPPKPNKVICRPAGRKVVRCSTQNLKQSATGLLQWQGG